MNTNINNHRIRTFSFLFLFALVFSNFTFSQNCALPNGKYKVEFDKQFEKYPEFSFEINGDKITYYDNEKDGHFERRIEKNKDCILVIEKEEVDEEKLNKLQKVLNKQHPYYSFKQISENEYEFIYRVDLHVMINSGKLIKQ